MHRAKNYISPTALKQNVEANPSPSYSIADLLPLTEFCIQQNMV